MEDMFLMEEMSQFSPELFFKTTSIKTSNKNYFD